MGLGHWGSGLFALGTAQAVEVLRFKALNPVPHEELGGLGLLAQGLKADEC